MSSKRESVGIMLTLKVIVYAVVGFSFGLAVLFTAGWYVYGLFNQQ